MTNPTARSVLATLREGQVPDAKALSWFAQGLADGGVSDAQAGAFAMGVCRQSLGADGRAALTLAMRDSGEVLSWGAGAPILDKHSTGGVGDPVSLILAPALAACGARVPMISGRGLGHTGGTLDKLEAIPGVSTGLRFDGLKSVLDAAGCVIASATANIAPADKRLYAIRDVTSTVESLDLITASILSKKLAAGLEGLVLDVKVGSGAFMKTLEEAEALACALVDTANAAGCPTTALITDMHQPLSSALGNALEVADVMQVMSQGKPHPLIDVCAALGGALLAQGGLAQDAAAGGKAITSQIINGQALEVFGKMIVAMGGPLAFTDTWQRFLPEATVIREVTASAPGFVSAIDGEALGLAVVELGGGRKVESDVIDPSVGLSSVVRLGAKLEKGAVLAVVHAARPDAADAAAKAVRAAITLTEDPPKALPPLIHKAIT